MQSAFRKNSVEKKIKTNKNPKPNKQRGWENVLLIGREHLEHFPLFILFLIRCIPRNNESWLIMHVFQRGLPAALTTHWTHTLPHACSQSLPSVKGIFHSEMKTHPHLVPTQMLLYFSQKWENCEELFISSYHYHLYNDSSQWTEGWQDTKKKKRSTIKVVLMALHSNSYVRKRYKLKLLFANNLALPQRTHLACILVQNCCYQCHLTLVIVKHHFILCMCVKDETSCFGICINYIFKSDFT